MSKLIVTCVLTFSICNTVSFNLAPRIFRKQSTSLYRNKKSEIEIFNEMNSVKITNQFTKQRQIEAARNLEDLDLDIYNAIMYPDIGPVKNDFVSGVVTSIDEEGVHVLVNDTYPIYLPKYEASLFPITTLHEVFHLNQTLQGHIIGTLKGVPVLSIRNDELITALNILHSIKDTNRTIDAYIVSINRGGAMLYTLGVTGFLPGSLCTEGIPTIGMIGKQVEVSCSYLNIVLCINMVIYIYTYIHMHLFVPPYMFYIYFIFIYILYRLFV